MRARGWLAVMVALAGLAGTAIPGDAHACGGLFCNGPPPNPFAPLPVAQNGENVVFAITPDPAGGAPTLEAHIQILYTGDAAKFSWVVPVDAAPTLSTGTDRLFTTLAGLTNPRYVPSYETTGNCIAPPAPPPTGSGFPTAGTGAAGTGGAASADAGAGVQVTFQGAVGPFDAAVVKSDDPTALKKWLTDNAYVVTDAASALIDAYVRENKYFVALKLLNGVGVRQIQPIVLTFRGVEACVPLRLTAIAANPDMPVLVWVLGAKRVAPRQYYELSIDEARIDWQTNGSNYFGPKGLVSQAANEAGGNAFITEYAGTSSIARSQVYMNGVIDVDALGKAMTPPQYLQLLVQMGLANDPLTLPLLAKYIPMPDAMKAMNVTEAQFYGNIQLYWAMFAFPTFDLPGLTAEISRSIVMPRMKAQMMIDAHPYLTRLNTFISPEEMTKDPFFFETRDLEDVSNLHTARINTMCGNFEYMACNAPQRLELVDGRQIWLRAGTKGSSCTFGGNDVADLKDLPAAHVVYAREVEGDGMVITDNSKKITDMIGAHNKRLEALMLAGGADGGAGAGGAGAGGAGGMTGAAGFSGAAGTGFAGTFGQAGSMGTRPPSQTGSHGDDACGCELGGDAANGPVLVGLAGALGIVLARRRRVHK
jgi:MYXO-CTERM domain-containing protein